MTTFVEPATDLHIAQSDNDLYLHFKTANGPVSVRLSPDMTGNLLFNLANAVATSSSEKIRHHALLLSIQEVSGRVELGVPMLSYELGCGVRMDTTIDGETARSLSQGLSNSPDANLLKH